MRNIILTGAGFSYNFNGFLSDQIWNLIFNNKNIQANKQIRGQLQNDFDFESVYYNINSNNSFSSDSKTTIQNAIIEAFNAQETNLEPKNITNELIDFIYSRFDYFFTLNQDLLIERFMKTSPDYRYCLPGIPATAFPVNDDILSYCAKKIEISNETFNFAANNNQKYYIKLHGSMNWFDKESRLLILGKHKLEDIVKSKLLLKYITIFEEQLKEKAKIFIIGYSFRDNHINNLIAGAIKNNSSIYVVDIQSPKDFARNIGAYSDVPYPRLNHKISLTREIWYGLSGYFQIKNINDLINNKTLNIQINNTF